MSKDKGNNGFLGGIIGALTVSLFNTISDINRKEKEDWDKIDLFDSFSSTIFQKNMGYKVKHSIDESKLKSKTLNLVRAGEYVYELRVEDEEEKDYMEISNDIRPWPDQESIILFMIMEDIDMGIIIFDNIKPVFWVYGLKERDNYVKIIISDCDLKDDFNKDKELFPYDYYDYFLDEYKCSNREEAIVLAKEMKNFYHKSVKRVNIIEKSDSRSSRVEEYRVLDDLANYYHILDQLESLNTFKYDEISRLLKNTEFESAISLFFTLYSLAIQLEGDAYFNNSLIIVKSLLKVEDDLLNKYKLKNRLYRKMLDLYIDLEDEKNIITLINDRYRGDHRFIGYLAKKLYRLELYEAARRAYTVFTDEADEKTLEWDLFEAYLRIEDDERMRSLRARNIKEGKITWHIDHYFNDKNKEALAIKITRLQKEKNWLQVIDYCNKYIKLSLEDSWGKIDDMFDYQIKKIQAYINQDNLEGAWITSCKFRRILISNFKGASYFDYLSRVEDYMSAISLRRNYPIDTIYHGVLSSIYKDLFEFYSLESKDKPDWQTSTSLINIIRENNLNELWTKVEDRIIKEYQDISSKTPRIINSLIIEEFKENNYILKLDEPRKLFPIAISRDFNSDKL